MSKSLRILEDALSEVGLWSWWAAKLPAAFQVEFSDALLWFPPAQLDQPPSGQVALRFKDVEVVAFLTGPDPPEGLPPDWPEELHRDRLDAFGVEFQEITLRSMAAVRDLVSRAARVDYRVGDESLLESALLESEAAGAVVAFWAEDVGPVVVGETRRVLTYEGKVPLEEVGERHRRWWEYYWEYQRRKRAGDPMPEDVRCEVIIPLDVHERNV